jgi:hypothetical protein
MDLDQIRIKLNHQATAPRPSPEAPPIDWPRAQLPRPDHRSRTGPSRSSDPTKLVNAVETLKQRSTYTTAARPGPATAPPSGMEAEPGESALQAATIHVKRLKSLADKINLLSSEQEHMMAEMRAVQGRLQLLQPHLRTTAAGERLCPRIDLSGAVLASAESDADTNLVVTYRSVVLPQPAQEAREVASHLRGTYGPRQGGARFSLSTLLADFGVVWQEPAQLLATLWGQIWGLRHPGVPRKAGHGSGTSVSNRSPWAVDSPSLVDMLLWFGGGLVGRLALGFILASFPALWSFAVATLTAVTAYALYRATLAPRRDFGWAYRVFLVIAGLMIGGRI